MSPRHRTGKLIGVLSSLLICASARATDSSAPPNPKALVEVNVRLLEYVERHFWCDYDPSHPTEPQGMGKAPWGRFEVTSPAAQAGRKFGVLFKCKLNKALIPSLRSGVGQSFVLVLPQDFLAGSYSKLEDCSLDSEVAKRWRPLKAR